MSASPSEQILTRIAARRDSDVVDLPPLYDSIDPEKLDAVVQSLDDGHLSFTYAGFAVKVTSDGDVALSRRASTTWS
ncbi:HalOD1 output domain-containing protein [Halobacterium jilantaiense]|uniref:Halobacterial output domain-containing protein n=1 Tax=Halobacterium jilantaiense TaxID=355548 RepID=A0A1I0NBT3_9EURY|nr:HalOD1 output domain-containing protein [Halobacterium jilantaiense]SEV98701.1 hypothetical protein SAMN04487945_0753 [Halobacterium jilantaiense]